PAPCLIGAADAAGVERARADGFQEDAAHQHRRGTVSAADAGAEHARSAVAPAVHSAVGAHTTRRGLRGARDGDVLEAVAAEHGNGHESRLHGAISDLAVAVVAPAPGSVRVVDGAGRAA